MERLLDRIIRSRTYREQLLASNVLPRVQYLCPKCGREMPFAGDMALDRWTGGLTVVCNECLQEFEQKLTRIVMGQTN